MAALTRRNVSRGGQGDFPQARIGNGVVEAQVALPAAGGRAYYAGGRFESAGFVLRFGRGGHNCFGANHPPGRRNPRRHDHVGGQAEEFAAPLVCAADGKWGEPFIKIGNGLYANATGEPPRFWLDYPALELFPWEAQVAPDGVSLTQRVADVDGYGYVYRKQVRLLPGRAALEIVYSLRNVGRRPLATRQYAHNFLALDGGDVRDFVLVFACPPSIERATHAAYALEGRVFVPRSRKVNFVRFQHRVAARDNAVTVLDRRTGRGVVVEEDYPTDDSSLFVGPTCVCPESNRAVFLPPGKSAAWRRRYIDVAPW